MTRPDPRLILALVAFVGSLILVATSPRAGPDLTAASPRQRPAVASPTVRASDPAPGDVPTPVLPAASPVGIMPSPTIGKRPASTEAPRTAQRRYSGASLRGIASWYCLPGRSPCTAGHPADGAYAAAGPALRTGDWRGRTVTVSDSAGQSVRVVLVDWCACPGGRLIDLYAGAFARFGPLARGLLKVEVSW
ncbi:MAG TPA: hypothetical protein VLM76_13430 [Patescibacteria group bacterium]|nr:hypothetical protein [Patescibacteria group bacterium]